MAGMDLSVSGLASGFDWKSMVDQLTQVERQPQARVKTEQADLGRRRDALGQIATRLSDLKSKAQALQSTTLYKGRTSSTSDATTATIATENDSVVGDYTIAIHNLATPAVLKSDTTVLKKIDQTQNLKDIAWGRTFVGGSFTVAVRNNTTGVLQTKQITVSDTDQLSTVYSGLATLGITATYDSATDTFRFAPPAGKSLVLGAPNDTSNILRCMKMFTPTPTGVDAVSSGPIGSLDPSKTLDQQNINDLTGTKLFDGYSSGSFKVNQTTISYDKTDTLATILSRISASDAGVTATYDQAANRIQLRNKSPGNRSIGVEDSSGRLMEALGLSNGILVAGNDLEFSIDGGARQRCASNTITAEDSGLSGITLTAKQTGEVTVNAAVDVVGIKKAVQDLVTSANSVQSLVATLTTSSRDASGKVTSGVLAYDQTVFQIGSAIRAIFMPQLAGPSSTFRGLEDLGFKTSGYSNEVTVVSESKLTDAITSNLPELQKFLTTASTGLAAKVVGFATPMVDDISGTIPTRQKAITEQVNRLNDQLDAMERRVQANRERMLAGFRAMEAAQSKSNQQLQFLNQKLGIG